MNTEKWKWFRYDEIFEIRKGSRLTTADMETGEIRYIGAIDSNNGVSNYIANDEHIHCGNTISVSYNGSVGYAYYQEDPFWATDDVNVLYPKFPLNKHIALFLCTVIEREQYRFNYGRKWTKDLMEKSLIKLPIKEDGQPDWQWMEDYVKNTLLPQLPEKARQVWEKRYDNKPLSAQKLELKTQEWKWFKIGDFFNVELSKGDLKPNECLVGRIPLISSGDTNNGVVMNIREGDGIAEIFDANTLTVDMFCKSYYQPQFFYAVSHGRVNILKPKFISFNQYIAMFLIALIDNERYKFSYGRAVYSSVIDQLKIKLPATTNEQGETVPDWQWMEGYIKGLPYSGCL